MCMRRRDSSAPSEGACRAWRRRVRAPAEGGGGRGHATRAARCEAASAHCRQRHPWLSRRTGGVQRGLGGGRRRAAARGANSVTGTSSRCARLQPSSSPRAVLRLLRRAARGRVGKASSTGVISACERAPRPCRPVARRSHRPRCCLWRRALWQATHHRCPRCQQRSAVLPSTRARRDCPPTSRPR